MNETQGALPRLTHAGPAEEIVGKELIAYDIANDGNWFSMSFSCVNGKQGSLRLPTECLKALIMTLPRMMTKALSARLVMTVSASSTRLRWCVLKGLGIPILS